jgi:hypothetical protein
MGAPEPNPPNVVVLQDNIQRFGDRLPTIRREIAKFEGEKFKLSLFEQWFIGNPIEEYIIHVHYYLAFNYFYFIEAQLMLECNDKTMNKTFEFYFHRPK